MIVAVTTLLQHVSKGYYKGIWIVVDRNPGMSNPWHSTAHNAYTPNPMPSWLLPAEQPGQAPSIHPSLSSHHSVLLMLFRMKPEQGKGTAQC